MKQRIETFKDELKHLHDYEAECTRLQGKIEEILYEMENVKGVNYSKQSGAYNEQAAMSRKLALIEKKEEIERQLKREKEKIKGICAILLHMPDNDRLLVLEVIADRRKYRDVCAERNIGNTSTLFAMINSIIEAALSKTA